MLYALAVFALFAVTNAYRYASCDEDPACRVPSNYTGTMTEVMRLIRRDHAECVLRNECPTVVPSITGASVPCINGAAGEFQCDNVELLAFVSLTDLGANNNADGNDIWGWTDPATGDFWGIVGTTTGTSFVRVSDPVNPVVVAWMPSQVTTSTIWRDMKVFNNFVYIVADRNGQQLQYYDMTQLRDLPQNPSSPATIQRDGVFTISTSRGNTHNIVMNVGTGIAYAVGCGNCAGGLYMMDVTGGAPVYAGCYNGDGYTHDAECVVLDNPDSSYNGRSICFAYNENTLTIVDVTDPDSPSMISRTPYTGAAYTHQGWLSPDHKFLFLDDELDESRGTGGNTGNARTYLWNVNNLASPQLQRHFDQPVRGIDHNLYVKGNYVYQANYEAGLRVLEWTTTGSGNSAQVYVTQMAFFDTYPSGNAVSFNGAWSLYPYFDSDFVILQDINRGLFILRPTNLDAEKSRQRRTHKY
jgi:choice-of-anchor B domain-containing protein